MKTSQTESKFFQGYIFSIKRKRKRKVAIDRWQTVKKLISEKNENSLKSFLLSKLHKNFPLSREIQSGNFKAFYPVFNAIFPCFLLHINYTHKWPYILQLHGKYITLPAPTIYLDIPAPVLIATCRVLLSQPAAGSRACRDEAPRSDCQYSGTVQYHCQCCSVCYCCLPCDHSSKWACIVGQGFFNNP